MPYFCPAEQRYYMNRTEVSQYLMKAALGLSLFFIIEYCLSMYALTHLLWAVVVVLLKCVTPVALYMILRRLRPQLPDGYMPGLMAWAYGVRIMLFAALPEAAFIYLYNQFLCPDALHQTMLQMTSQLEQLQAVVGTQNLADETIDLYRSASLPTAIESAVNMLSQDVMCGIFLMLIIAPIVRSRGIPRPSDNA